MTSLTGGCEMQIMTLCGDSAQPDLFHNPLAKALVDGWVVLNSGCFSTTITVPGGAANVPVFWAILKKES